MAEIDHTPPKIGGNRFSPEARKLARDREAKVLELRLRKVPFDRIAEVLGITKGAASKSFYRALRRIPEAFADQVRKEELESLERMEARVWREIDRSGQKTTGIYPGIDRVLAIKGRRSRLLGLDSPTEITLRSDESGEASAAKRRQQMLGRLTPVEQLRLLELMTKMRNENEVEADRGGTKANEVVDIRGTGADRNTK
jgi:hypothetical protein